MAATTNTTTTKTERRGTYDLKYSRDELENAITKMVIATEGKRSLFFAPGELELYPFAESSGYEVIAPQYQGMNLNKMIAPKPSFEAADLTGSRMRGAILPGADFSCARIWGVDLTESDLDRDELGCYDDCRVLLQRCQTGQGQLLQNHGEACRLHRSEPGGCQHGLGRQLLLLQLLQVVAGWCYV